MKKKSVDDLRQELADAKLKKEQLTHKLVRLENRKRHLEKGERKKRTHQLCNIGGAVEGVFPVTSLMGKVQLYELMEYLSTIPEVKNVFQRMEEKYQSNIGEGEK